MKKGKATPLTRRSPPPQPSPEVAYEINFWNKPLRKRIKDMGIKNAKAHFLQTMSDSYDYMVKQLRLK